MIVKRKKMPDNKQEIIFKHGIRNPQKLNRVHGGRIQKPESVAQINTWKL